MDKPERASIFPIEKKGDKLEFAFNPTQFSVSKSAKWNRPTTKGAHKATAPEFAGTDPASLQMEVFFDQWEKPGGDVSKDVDKLLGWLKPTKSSHNKQKPQPPILGFNWGKNSPLAQFQGYLKSVNVKYTMFRHDGTPTRATASIALEEIPNDPKKQNPTSGSVVGHRTYIVTAGDSLPSIAYQEYGNPGAWRSLATLNRIDDPLGLAPGATILVPAVQEPDLDRSDTALAT